ncbi:hypothetical protein B5M06_16500 [Comamonas kerstersii]|uniref:DUF4325 domain-containing protein n=1 Tax=Comamonas kerstersii TaxID=225992 RepID=A0A1V0BI44_9BURK|nr:hypothetical protein [Comamonas kerstersii]AQZ99606.1 hypothetical protein B5M06_16500 [Comamonas kerstersii]
MDKIVNVNLSEFQGRILSGRERGTQARELMSIDKLDQGNDKVHVTFPTGLWSVSSSFFLGMFGPSIIAAGTKDAFKNRYSFETKDSIKKLIDGYIDFALQNRNIFG